VAGVDPLVSSAGGLPHGPAAVAARPEPPATVLLNIKPWADVSVEGKSFGRTRSVTLPAGTYRFVFVHPDYEPLKRAFTLASAQTRTVTIDLRDEAIRLKK
jgi:hypothetical protein